MKKSFLLLGVVAIVAIVAVVASGCCGNAKVKTKLAAAPQAVVLIDFIGESLVLYPEKGKEMFIPGDNLAAIFCYNDGKSVSTYMWKDPAVELTLKNATVSVNAEEFVSAQSIIDSELPVWYKTTEALNEDEWLPVEWRVPFVADFFVIFKKDVGVIATENGTQEAWKILPFKTGKDGMTATTSVAVYNCENWSNWISGYGGTFYPARANMTATYLRFLHSPEYDYQEHSPEFGAFIFPFSTASHPQYWDGFGFPAQPETLVMPQEAIKDFLGDELFATINEKINEGRWLPATCGTTELIEKYFYRGEAYEKREEIATRIANMDGFVRRIRERIELFRNWATDEKAFFAEHAADERFADIVDVFNADFEVLFAYYDEVRPLMQVPEDCEVFSKEIVDLANQEDADEEVIEERCKELGRKIRTIGGAQDTTAAQFRRIAKNVAQKATEMYAFEQSPERRELLMHIRSAARQALRERMPHEGK